MASKPQPPAAEDGISSEVISSAVDSLLKWKAKTAPEKPQLLPEDDLVYLNLTLRKIPAKSRTNAFRIPLPHPLFDATSEVCLIIDDRPNSNLTSKDAKKIVKTQNIPVAKVLKLSKLKTDYKPFEAKRKLCDSYELFLVDRRIVHLLPKLLGKSFFKKKKLPVPLDLTHKNWKEQIERAMGSGFLFMRTGTCCVMKVGKVSMERDEIVENIAQGISEVVKVVPKKWGGVRSFHVKFSNSLALPIYQALPDFKLKIDGLAEMEREEIRETEAKEMSSGGEEKEKDKRKKKKKGRIHEVQYMDLGIGAVELDSDDDEDKNEEVKKMDAEEHVGNDVESEGDEEIDSDDLGIKRRKKDRLVRGVEKKEGKAAKRSRSPVRNAESVEKKEKKKSKLGARSKGSMKKATKSLSR
ncbi:OLC1v1023559C1 [Oldenlandia corymbosa var. corymbosa]|uniref:OLC1v1023559C1 n=1 Tax=Oldenlandia corymbosa var. corymbosa TaxID=529605 RepID=A0AAV1C1L9_OLDCO|nr:OLC1v1023559C1 [Oldenlandia corymbosa var. corymbosa]